MVCDAHDAQADPYGAQDRLNGTGHGEPATRALATEAVHAGREDLARQGLHAVPIDLSTTYRS